MLNEILHGLCQIAHGKRLSDEVHALIQSPVMNDNIGGLSGNERHSEAQLHCLNPVPKLRLILALLHL
jgi:hypothetical protein